jgi:hypothetical protein
MRHAPNLRSPVTLSAAGPKKLHLRQRGEPLGLNATSQLISSNIPNQKTRRFVIKQWGSTRISP